MADTADTAVVAEAGTATPAVAAAEVTGAIPEAEAATVDTLGAAAEGLAAPGVSHPAHPPAAASEADGESARFNFPLEKSRNHHIHIS